MILNRVEKTTGELILNLYKFMENQTDKGVHSSLKYLMQSEREYEKFEDIKKIEYILKEYIGYKNMVLKDFEDKPEVFFLKKYEDGTYDFQVDPLVEFEDNSFVIFRTLNKHIEIKFTILKRNGGAIQCRPMWAKIAKFPRKFPRIENKEEFVYSNDFLIFPPGIDLAKISGFTGQMILENEHKTLCSNTNSTLTFFDKTGNSAEISIMKLYKLPIAIKNTDTMENFQIENLKLFDLQEYYNAENTLQNKSVEYTQKNISCFVYYPVFFKNGKYSLPIGFFYFAGKEEKEIPEIIKIYQEIERNFNEKILKTNQKKVNIKQKVVNVSEGGFLLKITESELINSLKEKDEFSVDLVFKKQAPLQFHARVKYISEGNAYYVGAEIIGSSDTKKNMENLRTFLKLIPTN